MQLHYSRWVVAPPVMDEYSCRKASTFHCKFSVHAFTPIPASPFYRRVLFQIIWFGLVTTDNSPFPFSLLALFFTIGNKSSDTLFLMLLTKGTGSITRLLHLWHIWVLIAVSRFSILVAPSPIQRSSEYLHPHVCRSKDRGTNDGLFS